MILSTSCCEEQTLGPRAKLPYSPQPPSFLSGTKAVDSHWAGESCRLILGVSRHHPPSPIAGLWFSEQKASLGTNQTNKRRVGTVDSFHSVWALGALMTPSQAGLLPVSSDALPPACS